MILGLPFSKDNNYYIINSGILLLNLKKMREINMEKKNIKYTNKKRTKI
jgi:lipopolysaccharide biosynthesis glycosyltransferase